MSHLDRGLSLDVLDDFGHEDLGGAIGRCCWEVLCGHVGGGVVGRQGRIQ